LGQKLKVPSTNISSAELVRNSKSEEQEKIIKHDGTSELHKLDGHLLHSEDIRFVAQSLYRARRNIHSSLPKSREDVHNAIELMDTRKSKDEEFVITNDVPSGLIIFSCSSNLEFLTNSAEEIFVDGTFRFCPKFVYQLYTIHGFPVQ
jgi:hypothetical protein